MRAFLRWTGLFLGLAGAFAQEPNSAQRMEGAQIGLAGATWPKKPDQRLSSLSGKMKDVRQIEPQAYGPGKEFSAPRLNHREQEAPLGRHRDWKGAEGNSWDQVRWSEGGVSSMSEKSNDRFRAESGPDTVRRLEYREVDRRSTPDWASRVTPTAHVVDGSLRLYEGRLTRVRARVIREEPGARDLGSAKQEKFRPEEVEKILEQPMEGVRGAAKGRSREAFPPGAEGN